MLATVKLHTYLNVESAGLLDAKVAHIQVVLVDQCAGHTSPWPNKGHHVTGRCALNNIRLV